jgi:hypothetical protein
VSELASVDHVCGAKDGILDLESNVTSILFFLSNHGYYISGRNITKSPSFVTLFHRNIRFLIL